MTEVEKKRLSERFIERLLQRDRRLLIVIFTEDISWSLPGQSLMSGEARGLDATRSWSERRRSTDME